MPPEHHDPLDPEYEYGQYSEPIWPGTWFSNPWRAWGWFFDTCFGWAFDLMRGGRK